MCLRLSRKRQYCPRRGGNLAHKIAPKNRAGLGLNTANFQFPKANKSAKIKANRKHRETRKN
jgi:hypothetical protein